MSNSFNLKSNLLRNAIAVLEAPTTRILESTFTLDTLVSFLFINQVLKAILLEGLFIRHAINQLILNIWSDFKKVGMIK